MNSTRALFAIPVLAFLKLTACSSASPAPADPGEGTPDGGNTTDPDKGTGGDAGAGVDATGAVPMADGGIVVPSACAVTQKGTEGTVLVGTLLLPDSVENGEVLISGKGLIVCAAKDCSSSAGYAAATIVKCKDAVISPGLINPHDHISFADVPPQITSERFEHRHDWRKGLRGHKKVGTPKVADAKQAVRAAELRFLAGGATSSVSSGGTPGLIRNLDGAAAALEGLTAKPAVFDTFPLGDSSGAMLASGCAYPTRTTTAEIAGYEGYLPHIAEGVDSEAHNEMVCQNGAGPDAAFNLIQRQTAIIHGIAVTAEDVAQFRTQKAALVWSPRSNISLYGNTAPAVMYDQLGVQIALGTDWLPSGSMNLQRELKCADELNDKHFDKHFSNKQLWQMVTANAAFAAGMAHTIGSLKPGYLADIAIFNAKSNKEYRAVIDAQPDDVVLVMRGGKALYGDATLLDSLDGAACEPIPVCGVAKKACVMKDTGTSLAQVMADGNKVYPLFFCKGETITNEPSCSPVRADFKSGSSGSTYAGVASGDKDGDGIEDAKDNCPTVFSPVRPMDKSVQADTDGDGIGDACDKCPFESGETCSVPSANDIDGDTVVNGTDNCPEDRNNDQADTDGDGKGDACDKCPTEANPGSTVCTLTLTVAELRNPALPTHPAAGSVRATISGVEVTAVKSVGGGDQGFFVQVPGATSFGAIFVSMMNPTVKVGNVVDVTGTYEEVFALSYLTTPQVTVTDPKTTSTIIPLVVSSATLGDKTAGEPYEGMLVQVGPVAITKINPDAPKDYDEFEVTGPLRVDDYIFDALDNTAAVGTSFTKIVGVAGWSFANRKLWPRDASDSQ